MTTITTGTSGPKAWKMALAGAAVGVAAIVALNLPQPTTQQATETQQTATADSPQARSFFDEHVASGRTPALPESVQGFEYGTESTPGRAASPGVTTQYLGYSGELMPFENGSAPHPLADQAPTGFGGPTPEAAITQAPADAAQALSREPVGLPDAATNARWEALAEAYTNRSTSSYYTGDPDPAVSSPANANAEPHAPTKNQMR